MPPEVSWLDAADALAVESALALLRTEFPEFAREELEAFARGPRSRVAIARVEPQTAVVGVAAAEPRSGDLAPFEVFGDEALFPLRGIRYGVLSSAVVDASHRQKGVGRALAIALIEWLRSEQCEWLVATSFKSAGPNPSRPSLERLGFVAVATVDGTTYRRTNLDGRPCATCIIGPCSCSAVLMVTPLRSLRV